MKSAERNRLLKHDVQQVRTAPAGLRPAATALAATASLAFSAIDLARVAPAGEATNFCSRAVSLHARGPVFQSQKSLLQALWVDDGAQTCP